MTVSARANTVNEKSASVQYKPDAVHGLKLKLKAKQADHNAVLLGARYRNKYVAADAEVDVLPQADSVHALKTSIAFGARGFFVGGQAQVRLTPEAGKTETADEKSEQSLKDRYLSVCDYILVECIDVLMFE